MFKQNPMFLVIVFSQLTPFSMQKRCFAESTIKIVFSAEHSFCELQIVNNL